MKLPIGISDFKVIIENGYHYVDKTLFIQELKQTNGKVLNITRPSGFGKTVNLSMFKYFYENTPISNAHLFENTAIWKQTEYHKYQGAYPVIYMSFKNCQKMNWEDAYICITKIIAQEFIRYHDILTPTLQVWNLKDYIEIIEGKADASSYKGALLFLTRLLAKQYNEDVIVLIDDYDSPINAAYIHGYYKEMVTFLMSMLDAALKDNNCLERGILAGTLCVPRADIFGGLNNLRVKTLLDDAFSDKFGFTTPEVDQLLVDANLTEQTSEIKTWYNGYHCGSTTIYNPWSLLECVSSKDKIALYWSNTSDNELIEKIIARASSPVADELKMLLDGTNIAKEIDYGLVYPGIEKNQTAIWSLLLFTGYVTFINLQYLPGKTICSLTNIKHT